MLFSKGPVNRYCLYLNCYRYLFITSLKLGTFILQNLFKYYRGRDFALQTFTNFVAIAAVRLHEVIHLGIVISDVLNWVVLGLSLCVLTLVLATSSRGRKIQNEANTLTFMFPLEGNSKLRACSLRTFRRGVPGNPPAVAINLHGKSWRISWNPLRNGSKEHGVIFIVYPPCAYYHTS